MAEDVIIPTCSHTQKTRRLLVEHDIVGELFLYDPDSPHQARTCDIHRGMTSSKKVTYVDLTSLTEVGRRLGVSGGLCASKTQNHSRSRHGESPLNNKYIR